MAEIIESLGGATEIVRTGGTITVLLTVIGLLIYFMRKVFSGEWVVPRYVADDKDKQIARLQAAIDARDATANQATIVARSAVQLAAQPTTIDGMQSYNDRQYESLRREIAELKDSIENRPRGR